MDLSKSFQVSRCVFVCLRVCETVNDDLHPPNQPHEKESSTQKSINHQTKLSVKLRSKTGFGKGYSVYFLSQCRWPLRRRLSLCFPGPSCLQCHEERWSDEILFVVWLSSSSCTGILIFWGFWIASLLLSNPLI